MELPYPPSHPHLTEFCVVDHTLEKSISFRQVRLEQDLDMLFQWMHEPHVIPFWNLALPYAEYREHLRKFLADPHQALHIGSLDGVPMSYWETYWAQQDIVGQYYDADPEDQGVHLLIGPPSYLGKGYALPLLKAMVSRLFQHEPTEKVVAEPDIRNEKMIHIFKQCGFTFQKAIDLPDKRAALMFCDRNSFLRRWNHV